MNRHAAILLIAILLVPVVATAGPVATDAPLPFAVAIEQDGIVVPIRDHQVTLKRKPFTIVIRFCKPDAVLVNASFASDSLDAAATGKRANEIPGFSQTGMDEGYLNGDKSLTINYDEPYCWYYEKGGDHRFNRVDKKDGFLICRRVVEQFWENKEGGEADGEYVKVAESKEEALYLVFAKMQNAASVPGDDRIQWNESRRDWLKIVFE